MAGLDALAVGGGVTDTRDARHASGGLLTPAGPTVLDIRTGVLTGPGSAALVTGTSDTGTMTVQINPHVAVTSRGTANGAYLGPTLDAATKVNIAAAPGTGSRIDVVYAKQQDGNSGVPSPDVTTGPLYGVLTGVSSTGTPAKPDVSTIVGAVELATVQVAAGATATNGSGVTITNTVKQTVARGGVLPVTSTSRPSNPWPGLVIWEGDTGRLYVWNTALNGGAGLWDQIGGPPETYSLTLAGAFAAYATSPWAALQICKRGRECWFEGGVQAAASGGQTTLGAGVSYTLGTLPAAVQPIGSFQAAGIIYLAAGQGLTNIAVGGASPYNATLISVSSANAGWNASLTGLRWRTNN